VRLSKGKTTIFNVFWVGEETLAHDTGLTHLYKVGWLTLPGLLILSSIYSQIVSFQWFIIFIIINLSMGYSVLIWYMYKMHSDQLSVVSIHICLPSLKIIFGSIGDWIRALHLLGICSTTWASSLFFLIFQFVSQIESHAFAQEGFGPWSSYLHLLSSWEYRHAPLNQALKIIFDEHIIVDHIYKVQCDISIHA
jgi:hypothetical protein